MIHINSIQAQGAGFNFQLIFLIFTPNIWKKTWTQLDMKAHIWFRMGYIGEFNVHQPVYMIQIYIYIYHQHFTTNQLPSFGPGKGCPEPIFHRHRNPEVAFVVRSFGSSSYGLWWQAETWGRDFQGRKTRDQRVLFKRKANGFFFKLAT